MQGMRRATLVALLLFGLARSAAWADNTTTFTNNGGHVIYELTITKGPVPAGYPVSVLLHGVPGGLATCDIGPHTGIPMLEGAAGLYSASYQVTVNDNLPAATVVAHLSSDRGQASFTVNNAVAMLGSGEFNPIIVSVSHDAPSTMRPGDVMTVTMVGLSDGVASFDVGRHQGLPMTEYAPGNYVGHFTCGVGDVQPDARVTVHLNMPDGRVSSMNAPPSVGVLGLP